MSAITKLSQSMAIVAALTSVADFAGAALLAPGGVVGLAGTTVAVAPELAGTVQDDPLRPFEIRDAGDNLLLSGNFQDRVSRSDDLETLVFSPRLRDTVSTIGAAPIEIIAMTITGYGGYTTDVEFRTDGLGDVGPNLASRSADGEGLRFQYTTSPIVAPAESYFNSILTNATAFAPIGTATIHARIGSTGPVFSTTLQGINVPVPEPTSSVLVLGALGLAAAVRRR
ncbi:PEP-CTERM sorting domain-containing protein [Botrimarina mediterranea]|uniref:Ice-binding protein C-terminal domain-containing protein n=1 Tax=Botrimarina mediterranea TaxID=2528022 RepID=A0A518KAL3_9BACT|nr:PEP-CTERM sorting domain-containing protein [Botrimarina mediterranea]QDV74826.1 hypothetical protein Spa11_30350 [Botrimarina mediterranea]QDV79469.1 hypothetical protein K2D_30840 [Planctomycetes bacterium K2D]